MGTWIEIPWARTSNQAHTGRSLRGNVDRNITVYALRNRLPVVPYVGTWIEIQRGSVLSAGAAVVPYVGTWIEIS